MVSGSGSDWRTYTLPESAQVGVSVTWISSDFSAGGEPYGSVVRCLASTSTRTNQTRAGGRIIYLQDYGFLPTSIIGLGMSAPRNEQLGFAQ